MKVSVSLFALAAALAIGFASPGLAHQETAGNLKIGHPWVREAPAGAPGTYSCIIEIDNDGDEPETLLGATIDGGLSPSLTKMRGIGFDPVEVHFRDGVNTLLTAVKPAV